MNNEYFKITDDGTLKTSEIIEKMKSKFPVWVSSYYENIDEQFPVPKESTTRYFKKSVEPDEDTLGLSVNETLAKGITQADGITLRERLLMEIQYFAETGKHLDVKGFTFCSDSRHSDGRVPSVCLFPNGKVYVDWFLLDDSDSEHGIRRAVTLESLSSIPLSENNILTQAINTVKQAGYVVYKQL